MNVLNLAAKVNIQESVSRTTGRKQYRNNVPTSSPSQYYQRVITVPMLDYLLN